MTAKFISLMVFLNCLVVIVGAVAIAMAMWCYIEF